MRWQRIAAKTRAEWRERGVPVPPIVIFSITHQCNLQCIGCYARSFRGPGEGEAPGGARGVTGGAAPGRAPGAPAASPAAVPGDGLSDAKLGSIVAEAHELGVSFFVIAGGEPFLRPEIVAIAERFPRVLFLVFTNGVLIDQAMVERLARLRNVILLISLEGTAVETDQRRGEGTYRRLAEVMGRLEKKRLFFGCSLTMTSDNYSTLLDDGYIGGLVDAGCRFFLFAEYTPIDEATAHWVLTDDQRERVAARMPEFKKRFAALFVAVPWDEEEVGGCLSAGRGFVHINASGDVEPCPFAPYSDTNLADASLAEALRSPFLTGLRAMPDLSADSGGGCALWKNREAVESLLSDVG
ncbi:MAG: hypothetical protein A2133_00760 [Actinobacteria bacterium RBG_16_64_13]|nr:MAG: hypothetical protein A2133_00760 [Actinobacteria bacterium RBG_16_64_13]